MLSESNYNDYEKMLELQKELEKLDKEINGLFTEWENLNN